MANVAKRKLSNFDFSKEGCHVSLVGGSLGGPANDRQTLLLKSLNPSGATQNPSDGKGNKMEMIEKSAVDVMVQKAVDEATAAYKAEVEVLKAAAKAKADKERKDKLIAVLGTEGADGMEMAVKSLDDTSFDMVLKGFEAAKTAENKSDMFTEKGVTGATKEVSVETDTATRLAAKIAAKSKTEGK